MLKNKLLILSLLVLLFTHLLILKTVSFFVGSTQGENIVLKMGEWNPAESEVVVVKNGDTYSVEEKVNSENSSSFQQSFTTTDNQYLSFQYKVDSSENALGFDDPSFFIEINNVLVYQDQPESGVWKRGFINLKNHKASDGNYSLNLISKNTFDEINTPSLILKEVSTAKFLAKRNDLLKFSVSKPNAEIYLKYSVEENGVVREKQQILLSPYEFLITEYFYNNQVEYYSVDSFNNTEDSKFISIYTDFSSPIKIEDVEFFPEGDLELSATFTSPNDNFSNSLFAYEVGISNIEILPETNWENIEKHELSNFKKFGVSNLPSEFGNSENILLHNLTPGKVFVGIKSIDQAGNYSEISNTGEVTIY